MLACLMIYYLLLEDHVTNVNSKFETGMIFTFLQDHASCLYS